MANVSSSNSQGELVPKLRFPGFEGEWDAKELGDLLMFQNGINAPAEKYGKGIKYISVMDILNNTFITYDRIRGLVDIDDQTLKNYSVEYGDIVFQRSSETPEDIGHSNVYLDDRTATFGGFVIRGKKTGDYNPLFFKYLLDSGTARKEIIRIGQGAQHYNIGQEGLRKISLYFPKESEQKKIARTLELIDTNIGLHTALIMALKSYKRGLASALFERKIRMKRLDGSMFAKWEKVTLGDVFFERNERASGGEKLLAVTINSGIQERSNLDLKDNSSEDKSNYRKVYSSDIAYNTMRMWQGACGVSTLNGIVSPAYTVLYVSDKTKYEPRFWAYQFKEIKMMRLFQRNSQGLTSDTWNLKYDKFSKIVVETPSLEEQIAIADYIDDFSRLISMHEDSLSQMESVKRSLLSQMFI